MTLAGPVPGANTIRTFRQALTVSGQVVDATLVAAPKPCNIDDAKQAIKKRIAKANAAESKVRVGVEQAFGWQKGAMA